MGTFWAPPLAFNGILRQHRLTMRALLYYKVIMMMITANMAVVGIIMMLFNACPGIIIINMVRPTFFRTMREVTQSHR